MNTKSFKVSDNLYLINQEISKQQKQETVETFTNHIAIIDCSGSMGGELPKIREQLKKRLPKILKEKDTFSIIWFSGRGEFGTLLEAEPVATLVDLKEVEKAIDRWLRPQGLTGFKEPIEEVEKLVNRITKKNDNPFALLFMSDGCDNCWNKIDILKAVEKSSTVIQQSTFVEYGYYADRPLLTSMAEKAGGSLIFAEDFDSYAPTFENIVQKRVVGGPKIEVTIGGDAIRGFVWTMNEGDLVTYSVNGNKIKVPEKTDSVYYMSPTPVGETSSFIADGVAYAAMSLFSTRMMPDVVLPFLKHTGDIFFIEKFSGLFGKDKYSEFMQEAKEAAFNEKKRLTKGYDPKKIPADDAFTILDLLKLLASDDNKVLLDHEAFKYNRISRGRVDANTLLTDEEQEEINKLTEEMNQTKDVKKISELAAKIAEISNKPEPLKFIPDISPDGYSISSLTYAEEKPNISLLVRKTGKVDISKVKIGSLPDQFETFIFRNYAIVKDGLVNVETLPVKLTQKTLETLNSLTNGVVTQSGDVTLLNLKSLPVINRKMVKTLSAKTMFENEWELLKVQASQKVFNSILKEKSGTKKSEGFEEKYGTEGAEWLKNVGFTDYSGFSPKMRQAESKDVYMSKELSISIKGFSSIPSLNDFKKQAAKGKFTPSAQLMEPAVKEVDSFLASENDSKRIEEWLKSKIKSLDIDRRSRIAEKAQQVFSVIVGQSWFNEFSSIEENSLNLTIDGQNLSCSVNMSEKEIKI